MIVNPDQITTTTGAITAISATLASSGIYPQYLGLLAAISHVIGAWFTNKQ
ncbi:hypothetical protein [Pseudanabaena sp. 'Roaring Creek']|uniref:hypothetical protein n=1 Tax=Pseudanabaena sp. 'Roaring Creek' TaxID=1681830 RepID=UPI0012E30062|nr:hypothetical protein [Pseudanabaena sp. 'Roaring Creek']